MTRVRIAALLAALALIPACGGGGGGGGVVINVPVALVATPLGTAGGNVSILYSLSDVEPEACTVVVEFSVDGGGTWAVATAGPGGDGLSGLAADAGGSAHSFVWNSVADAVALAAPNTLVRVRITPTNSQTGAPGSTNNFTVDNSTNTAPTVSVDTPGGTEQGNVSIAYTLTDVESHPATIAVEFSDDGGATWSSAAAGPGGDGLLGLASSAGGTAHTFVWDSLADLVGLAMADADVRIRITATDTATGGPGSSGDFTVNNSGNTAPSVAVPTPGAPGGLIGVVYTLTDAESSTCSIVIEYSIDGGGTFFPATPGPGSAETSGLASSPGGTDHTYVWNSFADGVGLVAAATTVRVRVTPSDAVAGTAGTTVDFTVDNTGNASGSLVGPALPLHPGYTLAAAVTDGQFVYVGGHDFSAWKLEKVDLSDGSTAWSIDVDPSGGDDRLMSLATDGTHLWLAGLVEVAPFGDPRERIWRFEKRLASTGALVASFGTGGVVETANLGDSPQVRIAIDATSMIVSGIVETSPGSGLYEARLEKRALGDGSLVSTFGTNGVRTNAGGVDLALDATHMYCAMAEDMGGDMKLRVEKRRLDDGALEPSFGTAGAVTTNALAVDGAWELANAIVIDATHLYVFENVETGDGTDVFPWRISKRTLATGALVATVAGTGSSASGTSSGPLRVDGGALYVASRDDASAGDGQWRVEKRHTSDLSLDTTFNATGVLSFNPTVDTDQESVNALLVTRGVLILGGDDNGAVRRWRLEGRFK